MLKLFASCAKGIEPLLFDELQQLGATNVRQTQAGCSFEADQQTAYSVCLWSRLASRVFLLLAQRPVETRDDLYELASTVDWPATFLAKSTIAVDVRGETPSLNHTQFSARVVKDAVVDAFREDDQQRPSVDTQQPEIRIYLHLARHQGSLYLDLSGDALHKRGYRRMAGDAPLRETLAAAVVRRAGITGPNAELNLVDPFCGAGTLLLEALMVATDRAPGLARDHWGFTAWLGHRDAMWRAMIEHAHDRHQQSLTSFSGKIQGGDIDPTVLALARENADLLGFEHLIDWSVSDAMELLAKLEDEPNTGLILTNPPYAERLGDELSTLLLFRRLGQQLRRSCLGWMVGVIAPEAVLLKRLKLTSHKKYKLFNGRIPVTLALYDINSSQVEFSAATADDDIANRLRKNAQRLGKWAAREGVSCYRLYDADLPDYNAALDVYNDYLVVQEYAAPATIPDAVADDRLLHLLETITRVLPFAADKIVLKKRKRQQGNLQYEKQEAEDTELTVDEYNAKFKVNLTRYLDTGLFLDHRMVRKQIQQLAKHKRVLNLFAYTGSASVHAGLGGADEITTVDLSKTYLNWAKDNFRLNQLTIAKHQFIQADCLQWLADAAEQTSQWDLIFLDPPTFSNSKRMDDSFDVQRDHVDLLTQIKAILAPQGLLVFSTNKRKFKLDHDAVAELGLVAEDMTKTWMPEDFKRKPGIHSCWTIKHA